MTIIKAQNGEKVITVDTSEFVQLEDLLNVAVKQLEEHHQKVQQYRYQLKEIVNVAASPDSQEWKLAMSHLRMSTIYANFIEEIIDMRKMPIT